MTEQMYDVALTFGHPKTGKVSVIRWNERGETAAQAQARALRAAGVEWATELEGLEFLFAASTDAPGASKVGRRQRLTSDAMWAGSMAS